MEEIPEDIRRDVLIDELSDELEGMIEHLAHGNYSRSAIDIFKNNFKMRLAELIEHAVGKALQHD